MKKTLYYFMLFMLLPAAYMLSAYNAGSPGGKSGSPGDNNATCTQCHSGTATAQTGWISTNIPPEGYTPGETYTITATGTHSGVVKFGFELTAEDSFGNKTGTLSVTEPGRTKMTNANHAVTHTSDGTAPSGSSNSWIMEWTAPNGVGDVGFYAAFNAANGNGGTDGDVIYTSDLFVSEAAEPAITNVSPNTAGQGHMPTISITGENTQFASNPPVVSMSYSMDPGEMINGENLNVISNTQLEIDFNIPYTASAGSWDVHVGDLTVEDGFTVYSTVGLAEVMALNQVQLYPNPAKDHVNISNAENSHIRVYSLTGQLVAEYSDLDDQQRIDVTGFQDGVYIMQFSRDSESIVKKLYVKN